jgi:hypothetical protein
MHNPFRYRGARIALGLVAFSLGCSSSGGPPGLHDEPLQDGSPADGSSGSGDSSATGPDGAHDAQGDAPGDATTDVTAPLDGGDAGDMDVRVGPPPPPATCSQSAMWGAGLLLSISTGLGDELDSITPDELSIAWTTGQDGSEQLLYADRAASGDTFNAPQGLTVGEFTADRVALSADGLRLVVVNADGQGFSELTRTSRMGSGSTFGAPATGSYTNLNSATLMPGQSYGDPVLSADDNAFYYSIYGGTGQTQTIYRSARLLPGDAWPDGALLLPSTGLAAQGALRRRPTAISSDEQTLFVWDEVMGTERAAWIDESTGAFDVFVDLGFRSMAGPNAACTELYYSAQAGSIVDLYVAPN